MPISLISHLRSYPSSLWLKGFTLVELLISIGIILLLSTVVIVRFASFDSTTLLKSAAYELATTIREAQVYGVSVLGADPNFDRPFGVTFTSDTNNYTLFQFVGSDPRPFYDSNQIDVYTRHMDGNIMIDNLCVTVNPSGTCSDVPQLEISFRRPEFTALFYVDPADLPPGADNDDLENAQIKLSSTSGDNVWIVEVGLLGQISVKKEQP